MDLNNKKVPKYATEAIVFAFVRTGGANADVDGDLIITSDTSTGQITKRVFYHSFDQGAWSYNSENLIIPIGESRKLQVKIHPIPNGNFEAGLEVVGYRQSC